MTVSKRTRFEVLRRDQYACRYCKATDAPLVVDHVVPVALGGSDEPNNLATSCKPCNDGKASTSPSETIVPDIDEDALRWMRARRRAIAHIAEERSRATADLEKFLAEWKLWDEKARWLPADWRTSVAGWIKEGISIDRITEAMDIAWSKRTVSIDFVFRYMAGIIRTWLKDLDELTEKELATETVGDVQPQV